ncbi:MFS transporter [Streptomyces sp. NPDC059917]|uniref:MFS transporter n=1 Tax=Streptomyces sp. NPDC059917 TaxID=3347002 RepID=UPI0036499BD3
MPIARGVRIRIGYAGGAVVTGVFTTLPGLLLLPYLTDTLGVGAAAAGLVVLLPKAWDVVLTPVAGRLGDRGRSRTGSRRGHVLGGGAATAAAFALTFAGLARGSAGALLTAAAFTLTATAFAFFHASYAALPADLADTPRARMALVGGRVAGIAVAALAAGTVAPALVGATGGGLAGHRWAGLFGAALILTATLLLHRVTPPGGSAAAAQPVTAGNRSAARPWAVLRGTPGFAALVGCTALQVVATGCLMAAGPYFAAHALHAPAMTPALIAAFVLPNLVSMPGWTRLAARRGPRAALRRSTAVFAAGCALLALTPALPLAAPLVVLVAGTGHAGQLLCLYTLLAERCAEDDRHAHDRGTGAHGHAGVLAGLFGAAESLGLALGPFLCALALQLSGYVSSGTGTAAAQPASALWGVTAAMSVLPALCALAGIALLRTRRTASPAPAPQPHPVAQARL